jgi:hypothetical protein
MINPAYEKYTSVPDTLDCVTMVTLIHPYHGTVSLYFPLEDFQANFMGAIRGAWMNEATIVIQPANA